MSTAHRHEVGLWPLAQTTVYDNRLVASVSTPTAAMLGVGVPTTILRGDPTAPLIVTVVERLATAGPFERCAPESADHRFARRGPDGCEDTRLPRAEPSA